MMSFLIVKTRRTPPVQVAASRLRRHLILGLVAIPREGYGAIVRVAPWNPPDGLSYTPLRPAVFFTRGAVDAAPL